MSSEKQHIYRCTLCDQTWETLPSDAVQLTHYGGRSRSNTYKINNQIHVIKTLRVTEEK